MKHSLNWVVFYIPLQNEDNFARILEDDTACVCMKQGDGPKVCQPPNCDVGRPAQF